MSTSFHGIRIFFDVEKNQILFHNGDIDRFTATYDELVHEITVKYYGTKLHDPNFDSDPDILQRFSVTAPRVVKDNIEAWLYNPNISIDIEGTTGAEYDKKKKEMFELMKQNNEDSKKLSM